MDVAGELAQFLTTRRARITPTDVGLPVHGRRQVRGLRREEVASLAGVSVEYYKRLERGHATAPSDSVLSALADALKLDTAERDHLFDLARAAGPNPRASARHSRRSASARSPSASSTRSTCPPRSRTCAATTSPRTPSAARSSRRCSRAEGPNASRFMFLDPAARDFWTDWERSARDLVGTLRSAAGANPHDRALSELIGELSTRSPEFASFWATHNVRYHQTGVKRLCHPVVGELELTYEMATFAADELPMAIFTAEPGSRSAEGLALLGTWVATLAREPA